MYFDVKARLEEKERKSQQVTVNFGLLLATRPSLVKFELEGTATLMGKDEEIRKMLETNPETKVPNILPRIYQNAFTAMYLLSTLLNTPPPPNDLLSSPRSTEHSENSVEMQTGESDEEQAVSKAT